MSFAFGVSEDDVLAVAMNHGVRLTQAQCATLLESLDVDDIESAALYEDDLDEQTNAAHAAIWEQIQGHDLFAPLRAAQEQRVLDDALPPPEPGKGLRL